MRRNTKEADDILGLYFPVLDFGFVSLIDYMGDDLSVEESARVSYGSGTRAVSDTETLIRYLRRHLHTTPSEMVELKFHFAMPIFVARQFFRHRTFSYNEYSGRYSEVPDVVYTPDWERITKQSKDNKQGSSDEKVYSELDYPIVMEERQSDINDTFKQYNKRLDEGWAKELARIDLPVSTYTYFYMKCNLHNLFHFLRLRCDSHAQYEIRVYANVMAGMAKRVCPLAFKAWVDYNFCSVNFSRLDILFLNYLDNNYDSSYMTAWKDLYEISEDSFHKSIGMSKREVGEFFQKLIPQPVPNFDLDLSTAKSAEEMSK